MEGMPGLIPNCACPVSFWLPLRSVRQDTYFSGRGLREHGGSARPPNRTFLYYDCAHKKYGR
jgi:hypothetical protein